MILAQNNLLYFSTTFLLMLLFYSLNLLFIVILHLTFFLIYLSMIHLLLQVGISALFILILSCSFISLVIRSLLNIFGVILLRLLGFGFFIVTLLASFAVCSVLISFFIGFLFSHYKYSRFLIFLVSKSFFAFLVSSAKYGSLALPIVKTFNSHPNH